ncbi:HigA family addiction module antitoxin [Lactobacillus delbrueckii subsp. bulgaricus]|uniref:Toxin-antitoxin system antitoxin subunit n=1 Tax=Lactobacillus delbrueckii subsp. bulgaricus TaxID=1585 RepID=A0AAV5PGW1_LACDE|nr:HigA family addiction module antitoxin [Lactobacillus delbrueckii]ADY85798.1 DNA-binding protein [Lactobacillus delbrueckii subsp. bulgaricus 2038]MBT9042937.1 addiction module antidote protein, HigA family [Lactobacillus delbrueckii subsp. bulgaricus]GMB85214.1 toxin-antitoxin system antitoxin subunit [Lactobacillus delbrueckii subsp. bulgaricus]GMB87319.1 toxin-antitoxin system antitoxin subunit [Lactobacillus delbrueckii subsp. bulgaricus]GMB88873.1 toxin-antitoxin system antitoxin subun
MTESIKTPTVAETINDEYLQPLGLSTTDLAQAIHVPAARIKDILHGSQEITADISLRLAKFFGVSDAYFLNLQSDIDLRDAKKHLSRDLSAIKPFTEVQAKNKESLN